MYPELETKEYKPTSLLRRHSPETVGYGGSMFWVRNHTVTHCPFQHHMQQLPWGWEPPPAMNWTYKSARNQHNSWKCKHRWYFLEEYGGQALLFVNGLWQGGQRSRVEHTQGEAEPQSCWKKEKWRQKLAEVTSKHMDQIDLCCGVMTLHHINFWGKEMEQLQTIAVKSY